MKQFTKQEKEDITKNYLINYNIQELAKQYGVSSARIRTVLRQQNVQIISDRKSFGKNGFLVIQMFLNLLILQKKPIG